MRRFDELTPVEQLKRIEALAGNALAAYDLPADARVARINYSENVTYRVDAPSSDRKWALRVHREGYHTRQGIASELIWIKALRDEAGVPTPIAVAGRDGELIQTAIAEGVPRRRHCVLFEWLPGDEPDENANLLRPFAELGEITARLHRHSKSWRVPDSFERLTWDFARSLGDQPNWGRWRDGMDLDRERITLLERLATTIERRLDAFGKASSRFGVIHADLRLANLLVDENGTRVIDFDDSGYGWYMYDFATAVSFIEHRPDVPDLLAAWVGGYRKALDLPAADEAEIPTFVMMRRLLLVAWIGSHSATDLAKEMGGPYTQGTCVLAEDYLRRFG